MLNEGDLPSFWAEESFLAAPAAGKGYGKAKEEERELAGELAVREEEKVAGPPPQQQAAESSHTSNVNRHTSLAPLPTPVPLLSALPAPAVLPAAIPVPSRRQSFLRPAHILPAYHPAHPRPLALPSKPTFAPTEPSHSTSLHNTSTSQANQTTLASQTSVSNPLITSTPLPASRPIRRQSLAAPTFSPILSLPSPAAHPDDMFARRARDSYLQKGIEPGVEEEGVIGAGGMTSTPRVERGVKFALPEMEEVEGISVIPEEEEEKDDSCEDEEVPGVEQEHIVERVAEPEKSQPQRRRASRAFLALRTADPSASTSFDPVSATKPTVARRASRAFTFPAPASQIPSAAPSRTLTSAPAPTPLYRTAEPPLSVIRLSAPRPTRPLSESNKSRTAATRSTSTQPTKKKAPVAVGPVLTLPKDFNFGARALEREAEKKKRAEEREREKSAKAKEEQVGEKRKTVSGWGVPAGEKRQKLASTLPATRPAPAATTLRSSAPASALFLAPNRPPRQPRSRPRRSSLAGSGAALTKEALEASVAVVGPKVNLERRVFRYFDGISEGADEEDEEPKAKVTKVAVSARRPLQPSDAHNKPRPLSSSHPAPPPKKPLSKPHPFTFSAPRLPSAPPAHLTTWQAREAHIPLARPMPIFEDPVPFVKRARVEPREAVGLRTEKRRVEREGWEKRQRVREEENRRLKEVQRARAEEEERIKLKALRDGLIVKAHPVPKWIFERKAALKE